MKNNNNHFHLLHHLLSLSQLLKKISLHYKNNSLNFHTAQKNLWVVNKLIGTVMSMITKMILVGMIILLDQWRSLIRLSVEMVLQALIALSIMMFQIRINIITKLDIIMVDNNPLCYLRLLLLHLLLQRNLWQN